MKAVSAWLVSLLSIAAILLVGTTASGAKISGYLIVHNDTSVTITVYLDGKEKGSIPARKRSSWLVGDTKERESYTISAEGSGVAKQTVASGEYSNFTWRVSP